MSQPNNSISPFTGPIFVVGISRSGTKLLRDLLNNHSMIAIPRVESKFIPSFYNSFGQWDSEKLKKQFGQIFDFFVHTVFYEQDAAIGKHDPIDQERWFSAVRDWHVAGVVEALFRLMVEREGKSKVIWGDKTPNYLLHIGLLKTLFPSAKFVHIIRDVRDVALSARNAWRRHIYVSAQRWSDYIIKCRQDAKDCAEADYLEVSYESLIDEPKEVLGEVCRFLGIPVEPGLEVLHTPMETVGAARGMTSIAKGNTGKWKVQLSQRQLYKIESICGPLMMELGYSTVNGDGPASHYRRIGKLVTLFYRVPELMHSIKTGWRKKRGLGIGKELLQKIKFRLTQ